LALLPLYHLPLSFLLGSFVPRHILFTIVGLTISLAILGYRSSRGDRLLGTALTLIFLGWFALKAPAAFRGNIATNGALFESASWMDSMRHSDLPVAVTPAVFFLQLQHYAPADMKSRITYPVSVFDAIRYDGANTGEVNLKFLSQILPINALEYDTFVLAHPHFLLCSETKNPTWLIRKLLDDGAALRLITRQGSYFLFEVNLTTH
jgi:hypothetical protein